MSARVCGMCKGTGKITHAQRTGSVEPDATGARIFDCPTCLGAGVERPRPGHHPVTDPAAPYARAVAEAVAAAARGEQDREPGDD